MTALTRFRQFMCDVCELVKDDDVGSMVITRQTPCGAALDKAIQVGLQKIVVLYCPDVWREIQITASVLPGSVASIS